MDYTELHFFDFDGTLFRSPEPPPGWGPAHLWYDDPASLTAPCVPTFPPATWWITSTVAAAKKAISDSRVYTVMATGRLEHPHRDRIDELLHFVKLDFDEWHLRPHGQTTDFKMKLLRDVLRANPSIHRVELWEDRERNMALYRTFLEGLGYPCRVHPVKFKAMPPRCRPPSPVRVASAWLKR